MSECETKGPDASHALHALGCQRGPVRPPYTVMGHGWDALQTVLFTGYMYDPGSRFAAPPPQGNPPPPPPPPLGKGWGGKHLVTNGVA